MKHNKFPYDQNQKPAGISRPIAASDLNQSEVDFAPSPGEVARRAGFTFVNQGSLSGRDVQHWLAAEAELPAGRNLTRVHGFPHRT